MRLCAFVLAAAALWPSGGARSQTFVLRPDTSYASVAHIAPPAHLRVYESTSEVDVTTYLLAAFDAEGGAHIVADLHARGGSVVKEGAWQIATAGCGTACFYSWFLDTETGALSGPIFAPVYTDAERGIVALSLERGLAVFDPFEPAEKWIAELDPESDFSVAARSLSLRVELEGDGLVFESTDGAERVTFRLSNLDSDPEDEPDGG